MPALLCRIKTSVFLIDVKFRAGRGGGPAVVVGSIPSRSCM